MKRVPFLNILVAAAAASLLLPIAASAQYVWLDEKGTKQFSDMPPPASVPRSRIIKQGGGAPVAAPQDTAEEKPSAPDKAEPSLAERNAEFRKRRAEQAEKEKKAREESARAAENSRNCDRAREYQRTLDSGERVARMDKNGERAYLTDEQRTQESRDNKRILAECK